MLINRQFGEYLLLKRLAVGGQSEVFLATKLGPHDYTRPVVIKALPSSQRDDHRFTRLFYREAFVSSRFNHPNVINIHDAKLIEGEHCMLMDFVSGQTVADIAQRGYKRNSPPTLKQVVRIIADACEGLAYVHDFKALDSRRYSVVHRDISPQNLMVTYQGVTMVFDFGIARVIGLDEDEPSTEGGKFAYMSPEQIRGEPVDPRSDIFSLGVILYELATGYRLFRRKSPQEVLDAVLKEPIESPRNLRPEIPQFLENAILKALERDPFKRYQTAQSLRQDLEQFLEMTSEGKDIRRGLGAYVAALFRDEQSDIADVLRNAPKLQDEARPVGDAALGELGDVRTTDPTLDLEFPREKLQEAQAPVAAPVVERPAPMNSELETLRRRQSWLVAGLVAAIFLVFVVGWIAFL